MTTLAPLGTTEWIALLAFATAMSFTPGPNTTLSAALAANQGLRRALRFVCAVPLGWGLMLLLCAFGLDAALRAQPALREGLRWAGLAYMGWLAWRLWQADQLAQADERRFRIGFGEGVLLQFLNVKAWTMAFVITGTWITSAGGGVGWRLAQVAPVLMAFALASNLTYALIGASLRGWLAVGRRLSIFNRTLAVLLAATALWMARL